MSKSLQRCLASLSALLFCASSVAQIKIDTPPPTGFLVNAADGRDSRKPDALQLHSIQTLAVTAAANKAATSKLLPEIFENPKVASAHRQAVADIDNAAKVLQAKAGSLSASDVAAAQYHIDLASHLAAQVYSQALKAENAVLISNSPAVHGHKPKFSGSVFDALPGSYFSVVNVKKTPLPPPGGDWIIGGIAGVPADKYEFSAKLPTDLVSALRKEASATEAMVSRMSAGQAPLPNRLVTVSVFKEATDQEVKGLQVYVLPSKVVDHPEYFTDDQIRSYLTGFSFVRETSPSMQNIPVFDTRVWVGPTSKFDEMAQLIRNKALKKYRPVNNLDMMSLDLVFRDPGDIVIP